MKIQIIKTDTSDERFLVLERLLDVELLEEFPESMHQYAPHNKFKAPIKTILLCTENNRPVACGAFKELGDHVEIKRMFVHPAYRGKGYSKIVLEELEQWARSNNYDYAKLETGDKLKPAIQLYQSAGYRIMPNYGPYVDLDTSICMKKNLK